MKEVSFIVVAHNEEKTISRCISAIEKLEGLDDYEIVVVDDGSTDKTAQIVRDFVSNNPKIILRQLIPNQGRGAARKEGAETATGKYFAYIDSDIVLPPHWLKTCMSYMDKYDAVGGVAVPDGDVNYVYALLDLEAKVVSPTTTISGSNGLYKSEIFKKINFGQKFRDGEDSVFNKRMKEEGFKTFSIQDLIVEHREARTFFKALVWLYQTGRGATRQLKQYKDIRMPDLAYFALIISILFSVFTSFYFERAFFLITPLLFVLLVDCFHFNMKFKFKLSYIHKYIFGILVYWFMLCCYFAGRTAGWFVKVPKGMANKKLLICFDYEGKYGMPYDSEFNLDESTNKLIDVLNKNNAKATFFTVGKIIEENIELVKKIHESGHEIGIHGYLHEHLNQFDNAQLKDFEINLNNVEKKLLEELNLKPRAFRSPFLMGPKFYSKELYFILKNHGYEWVSNREVRYPEELFRPDRINLVSVKNVCCGLLYKILLVLLNIRTILTDNVDSQKGMWKYFSNISWLLNGAKPFQRYSLLEVPLHTPMDCDLLGLPKPMEKTSDEYKDYMLDSIINVIERRDGLFILTFHDWIMGCNNRIELFDELLQKISKIEGVEFITKPLN